MLAGAVFMLLAMRGKIIVKWRKKDILRNFEEYATEGFRK